MVIVIYENDTNDTENVWKSCFRCEVQGPAFGVLREVGLLSCPVGRKSADTLMRSGWTGGFQILKPSDTNLPLTVTYCEFGRPIQHCHAIWTIWNSGFIDVSCHIACAGICATAGWDLSAQAEQKRSLRSWVDRLHSPFAGDISVESFAVAINFTYPMAKVRQFHI